MKLGGRCPRLRVKPHGLAAELGITPHGYGHGRSVLKTPKGLW